MIISSAKFVTSIATDDRINEYDLPEIAVVGRSNVGKSSFINFLVNQKGLAKVSSTQGKTRLINLFEINGGRFHLVDLPGYGYAKVPEKEKEKWALLIDAYLSKSKNLKLVIVLVDIRHDPTALDKQMMAYLSYHQIPFIIVATKADKLSRNKQIKSRQNIANIMECGRDDILICSALQNSGKEEILNKLDVFLN